MRGQVEQKGQVDQGVETEENPSDVVGADALGGVKAAQVSARIMEFNFPVPVCSTSTALPLHLPGDPPRKLTDADFKIGYLGGEALATKRRRVKNWKDLLENPHRPLNYDANKALEARERRELVWRQGDWNEHPSMLVVRQQLEIIAAEGPVYEQSMVGLLSWLTSFVEWTHMMLDFPVTHQNNKLVLAAMDPDNELRAYVEFIDHTIMNVVPRVELPIPGGWRSGAPFVVESIYPDLQAPGVEPVDL